MCEISILDPREASTGEQLDRITSIYEAMPDGIGVVYVRESDDRTAFEYEVYKSITPNVSDIRDFIEENQDGAIRCVIHGRLATCGKVSKKNAHPIRVECDECDVEYVAHNGTVYSREHRRRPLQEEGHTFQTPVDSEVIAHAFGEVPSSFEGADEFFEGQPAYVLLGSDAMYIHASTGYHLTERGTVARTYRSFGPERRTDNYQKVILTPTNGE